jgi:hypothetical protein
MRKLASIWPILGCAIPFSMPLVTYYLAGADLRKKPLCLNLNHRIPKVGTMPVDRGINKDSKTSQTLANMGNMMLLPKLAKQREFDPCERWVVPVPDSNKDKIRRVREAQEKYFQQQWSYQFWGFSMTKFFPS